MKRRILLTTGAAALLMSGTITAQVGAPTGALSVNDQVQVGTKPLLSWKVIYPEEAADLVTLAPTKTIEVNKRIRLQVRMLGVAFQSGPTHLPVRLKAQLNGGAWDTLFYGRYFDVDPEAPVFDRVVEAGSVINFQGEGQGKSGGWYGPRSTTQDDVALTALFNGEKVPEYAPAYDQGRIESFLTQYIAPDNTVTIGSQDIIYLFECATRNTNASYFDMQDLVMLVTFIEETQ